LWCHKNGLAYLRTSVFIESEGAKLSIGAEGFKLEDTSDELYGPTGVHIEDHLKGGETVKDEVDVERRRKLFFKKIVHLVRTSTGGREASPVERNHVNFAKGAWFIFVWRPIKPGLIR
jgi:hypothetical protein